MNNWLGGASCAVLVIAGLPAHAQIAGEVTESGVEIITVTTQKREQTLKEVPINVTAYRGEFLDTIGVEQFDDLSDFVPGLEIQEQSPNNPGFVIRGITSDSGGANIEPRVSIYQDGVPISKSRGSYVELFDVERAEVAKGPQSTLYGRGALIGAINIIQNKAKNEISAELEGGVGNLNSDYLRGHVNAPLIDDQLYLRVAAIRKTRDGYVDNVLDGVALNSVDVVATRVSLRYEPTPDFSADVIFNFQQDEPTGTSFKSGTFPPSGGDTNPASPAALNTFGGFERDRPLGLKREVWSLTGIFEYSLSDAWTVSAISGLREFRSLEIFDPDGFAAPLLTVAEDASGEQFTQELRFNFDNGGPVQGFFGANYFYESGRQRIPLATDERTAQQFLGGFLFSPALAAATEVAVAQGLLGAVGIDPTGLTLDQMNAILVGAGQPAVDLDDPANPYPLSLSTFQPLSPFYLEETANFGITRAVDVFADLTWQITPSLSVTAGGRYTHDDKRAKAYGRQVSGQSNITPAPTLFIPATPGGFLVDESDEFDGFTWRFVGKYDVTEDLNVWASYARGRRPEVIAFDSGEPDLFETVAAETVNSYELGAFANLFDGRATLNGSVFYNDYENFQTGIFDPGTADFITVNAGSASTIGVEGQFIANVTEDIEVFATYAFNRARFDDEDSSGQELEFADNQFRLAPDHAISVGATASREIAGKGTISFTPTFVWQSEVFFEDDNDPAEREDAYGLIDLRLRYDCANERFSFDAFVDNVADKEYIIDAGNTGGSFGIPTFIAGPPRTWGVRATVRM